MLSMARRSSTYSQFRPVRRMDILRRLPIGHAGRALRRPVYLFHYFAIQRLGSRARARPCPGRFNEWTSSGSFLQVMPAGRFDDHRPVYLLRFLRSSAWSRRVRARLCSGVARRCDGGQSAGHPYCGGRLAYRRGPPYTAHA